MPKDLLDIMDIRTVFQQMRRKGVAQRVRGDVLCDIGGLNIRLQDFPKALSGKTFSGHVYEQSVFVRRLSKETS